MTQQQIKEKLNDFTSALQRLDEALAENPKKGSPIVDGCIQRFEFTFELAWKVARLILMFNGIDARNPRAVIKEAFQQQMIQNGEAWIDMLEDRNKTSHLYDQNESWTIYQKIREMHVKCLKQFEQFVQKTYNQ